MDRIKPDRGFLHLVVANEDDYYYTSDYLRLDYQKYMFSKLIEQGYECIYFLDGVKENCTVSSLNEYSDVMFKEAKNRQTIIQHIFGGNDNSEKYKNLEKRYVHKTYESINKSLDAVKSVCSVMRNNKTAVIINLAYYYDLCCLEKPIDELKKLEGNNKNSIVIISLSADSEKNIRFFSPGSVEDGNIFITEKGVLRSSLFGKTLKNMIKDTTGYCMMYDILKSNYRDCMVFLNRLEYEDFYNITMHYFLRNVRISDDCFEYCRWFAVILWACDKFPHYKYLFRLKLEENPLSKAKTVNGWLDNRVIYNRLVEITDKLIKQYKDAERFKHDLDGCMNDDMVLPVFGSESNMRVSKFEDVVQYCCKKLFYDSEEYYPDRKYSVLQRIEDQLKKNVTVQNSDYNAESAMTNYMNMISKKVTSADSGIIKRLFENESFWNTFESAIDYYYTYINNYIVNPMGETDICARKTEAVYSAMLSLSYRIAESEAYYDEVNQTYENEDEGYRILKKHWYDISECVKKLRNGNSAELKNADFILNQIRNII